jgi:uncharacterized C2H2 Zn-finger protein
LLPLSRLLIPPKTSSPNTTYRCITCNRIYRKRASLQYHIGKVHLHIYPVRHLQSSSREIRLQDLPRSNSALRPNHGHHSLAFVVGWFALGRSTYCASAIIAAANGGPLLAQTIYFFVHWNRPSVPSDPESIRNSQDLRMRLLTAYLAHNFVNLGVSSKILGNTHKELSTMVAMNIVLPTAYPVRSSTPSEVVLPPPFSFH